MYYYIISMIIIAFDQLTKYFVVRYVKPQGTIPIIEDVFHLTYAENTGAAFSILPNRIPLLTIVTSVFILFLIIVMTKMILKNHRFQWATFALSLIIGGAIGNLIDRVRLGYVIDFLDFRLVHFAIFNIADSFIVVGSILLIITILFEEKA